MSHARKHRRPSQPAHVRYPLPHMDFRAGAFPRHQASCSAHLDIFVKPTRCMSWLKATYSFFGIA
jgi:hypothetical protein